MGIFKANFEIGRINRTLDRAFKIWSKNLLEVVKKNRKQHLWRWCTQHNDTEQIDIYPDQTQNKGHSAE